MRNTTKGDRTRQAGPSPRALSPAQLAAVDLVVLGKSDGEVGETVGVGRQRVWAWRHYHPEFRAALNTRRREVFGQAGDRLRTLLGKALDVLAHELDNPARDEWQVKVALKILDYAGGPVLANQVALTGPEDAEELLEAEAGRRHGDGLSRLLAGVGPSVTDELRQEWAARLAEAEASDGHDATAAGNAVAR